MTRAATRRGLASLIVLGLVLLAGLGAWWWRTYGPGTPTAAPSPGRPSAGSGAKPTAKPTGTVKPTVTAKPTVTVKPTASAKPSATTQPTSTPVPGVSRRPKDAQPMTVTYVYDGDTLQLQAAKPGAYVTSVNKIKVRLVGVNTPEMTPKKQCFAPQATARLQRLTPVRSRVWVKPDRDSWDDYRRRLFLVWNDAGTLVDHDLVAGGYGQALRIYPNITYWPTLEKAQNQAKKAKRGLWGAC